MADEAFANRLSKVPFVPERVVALLASTHISMYVDLHII